MTKTRVTRGTGLSRRDFLRLTGGGCAALGETSLLATLMNLNLIRSAAAATDTSGYKAIVCILLYGGIDSYNLLVPTTDGGYEDYAAARTALALPQGSLHPILDGFDGRGYGLHPGLGELQGLYDAGKLTFVANIGSLIEPVDLTNYRNGARLPLGLFSHSDQQRHWQTGTPQSRTEITGWLGRVADILTDTVNRNPSISMNIAIENLNILQTGRGVAPYVVDDNNGAEVLQGYGGTGVMDRILTQSLDNSLDQSYANLLKQTYASLSRQSIDAAVEYNDQAKIVLDLLTASIPGTVTALQSSGLGRQLLQVAKAIGAQAALGQDRQVFFTGRGGWDNHANLLGIQGALLPEVSGAIKAFHDALTFLGQADNVVTFTASDFARTLSANTNNGSDHAWGGNHIVMGGALNGGRLYGRFPDSLAPGNAFDLGRGRLIPSVSVDEYAAELAMWFGIPNDANLAAILPNIRNFYGAGQTLGPLGMLTS